MRRLSSCDLSLEQIAARPLPGTAVPLQLKFTDTGDLLYLLAEDAGLRLSLWRMNIASGQAQLLVRAGTEQSVPLAEELRRQRTRWPWHGISSYQHVTVNGESIVLYMEDGRTRLVTADARTLFALEHAVDPRLFGAGRYLACVIDRDLCVADIPGGTVRHLVRSDEDGITYGLAEYAAQEELGRSSGYWPSPSGSQLAFARVDVRHLIPYLIPHWEDGKGGLESHPYPFVGGPNAKVDLGIVDLEGGPPTWLDLGAHDGYLARVRWIGPQRLAVAFLARNQRRLEWTAYDSITGQRESLFAVESEPWINLTDDTRFLASGEILDSSEESGYRHLIVRAADDRTKIRQLTTGPWMVTELLDIDETRRIVYFTATLESPLERHVYAVSLDGGEMIRLTTEPGTHQAVFASDHLHFVDQYSARDHAPRTVLRRSDQGGVSRVIHGNDAPCATSLGLQTPDIVHVQGANGTPLFGAVYRPLGVARGARTPAVVAVYGGPTVQTVTESWHLTMDLEAQYLAQHGILVFKLDNRGSAGRGLMFERTIAGRFGSVEVEDQVAGAAWLIENCNVDPGRIGIMGWSYGGFMTLSALLKAPDVFSVGVAGAPVTDAAVYDSAYTEKYMATPETNADGYLRASVIERATALHGSLLIIHGFLDENVHFRHTTRFVEAVQQAGGQVDLMMLPTSRHMPQDFMTRLAIARRRTEFLLAHL